MTRPFRIVHIADCHLDAPCRSLIRDVRDRIEVSARTGFERAIKLAGDARADAVVIAGDLFDRDLLRIPTELWLPGTIAEATDAGVAVIAVTGNHDPGAGLGPLDRIAFPPAPFTLVRSREPQLIRVDRSDGSRAGIVVAAGHEVAREHANLVAAYPPIVESVPVVGLVHAQVHGYEGEHDRYAPCSVDDLRRPGYDYWALGHVHQAQAVRTDPSAWYSGCLQGRHFGETGAKGALLVEIWPEGTVDVAFHPLAPVRFDELVLDDLDHVDDMRALVAHVEGRFGQLAAAADVIAGQEWIVRVRLTGRTPVYAEVRGAEAADDLAHALRERLGVLDVEVRDDGVAPPVDVTAHRGQPHVLGTALDLIEAARDDEALLGEIAPERLAGAPTDPVQRAAYLRGLLDGLDVQITAAMLEERDR